MSKTEKKVHGKQNRKYGKICQVSEERPTKSSDDRYMFSVNSVKFVMENINVNVENVNLKMIIDSGASSYFLGKPSWNFLKENHVKCVWSISTKELYAYGSFEDS